MRRLIAIIALTFSCLSLFAQDGTCLYATHDGQDLFLDYYKADSNKPAIIFLFGGGFLSGARNEQMYIDWCKVMAENGYPVFSIDYRLGLAGSNKGGGAGQVKEFYKAIQMVVEDLYAATSFIVSNAEQFEIDPEKIVIAGSSSGALSALAAEWQNCNGKAGGMLPEGFKYAGVISFAGALLSNQGKARYKTEPAPHLFIHGTADKVVHYNKVCLFNWRLSGSKDLGKIFKKNRYNYNILRYLDHGHDIANSMSFFIPEQIRFLETNVSRGVRRIIDAQIDDPDVPVEEGVKNRRELYEKN